MTEGRAAGRETSGVPQPSRAMAARGSSLPAGPGVDNAGARRLLPLADLLPVLWERPQFRCWPQLPPAQGPRYMHRRNVEATSSPEGAEAAGGRVTLSRAGSGWPHSQGPAPGTVCLARVAGHRPRSGCASSLSSLPRGVVKEGP